MKRKYLMAPITIQYLLEQLKMIIQQSIPILGVAIQNGPTRTRR